MPRQIRRTLSLSMAAESDLCVTLSVATSADSQKLAIEFAASDKTSIKNTRKYAQVEVGLLPFRTNKKKTIGKGAVE